MIEKIITEDMYRYRERPGSFGGGNILYYGKKMIDSNIIRCNCYYVTDFIEILNDARTHIPAHNDTETDSHVVLKIVAARILGSTSPMFDHDFNSRGPDVIISKDVAVECGSFSADVNHPDRRLAVLLDQYDEVWHLPYTFYKDGLVYKFTRSDDWKVHKDKEMEELCDAVEYI